MDGSAINDAERDKRVIHRLPQEFETEVIETGAPDDDVFDFGEELRGTGTTTWEFDPDLDPDQDRRDFETIVEIRELDVMAPWKEGGAGCDGEGGGGGGGAGLGLCMPSMSGT